MSITKSTFKKQLNGEYSDEVKEICKQMYVGEYRPEGYSYYKNVAAIAKYTGIKKNALTNWQRRYNWDEGCVEKEKNIEMETSDDLYKIIASIKMNNLKSIEKYVRNNIDLTAEEDLKKRIDGLKVMLQIEETLLSPEERKTHNTNDLLKEIDNFEEELMKKSIN